MRRDFFTPATLQPVLDQLHEGFQLLDRDLRYLYLNEAALAHARMPRRQLVGRTLLEAYPGTAGTPLHEALLRCLASGVAERFQNEFEYADGRRGIFELRVQPIGDLLAVLSIDVTDRQEMQRQLRHSQRIEALGLLAGGVAHDFNNLLTVMTGFIELAELEVSPESPAIEHLHEVQRAVERASDLTRKLLAFAREAPVRPRRLDLNALVSGMRGLLQRVVAESSEIEMRLAPDLWTVEVDPGGVEQVLLNLALNARDAMPGGGRLLIETSNYRADEELRFRWGRPIPPGDYVRITVTDSGTGIARDHLERIFDPFFTTKGSRQGTGLGLSVCQGIVDQAKGYINVYSEVDQGSTFRIYLPRAREAQDTEDASQTEVAGRATVAVVEDDAQIRGLLVRTLGRAGYRVIDVEEPRDALRDLSERARLDLLISDVVMPGLRGPDLVSALRRTRPGLLVLFISGYPERVLQESRSDLAGDPLLEKPFTSEQLLATVRELLGP